MNRLYKTYLLLRYIAKKAITGDFGLDIKIEELDVPSFVDLCETDHVIVAIDNNVNTTVSASFNSDPSPYYLGLSTTIEQLENNYEFTLNSGLMFNVSIEDANDVESQIVTYRQRKINSNIKTKQIVTAGLYVDDIVPVIIFNSTTEFTDIYPVTISISDGIYVSSIGEFATDYVLDANTSNMMYYSFISYQEDEYEVTLYDADIFAVDIENVVNTNITSRIISRYEPAYVSTKIDIEHELPFTVEFEIQESTVVNLERPTVYIPDYQNVVTAEIHSETENQIDLHIELDKGDVKIFPLQFDADMVEGQIDETSAITPSCLFDFNAPQNMSLEVLLESCDTKAYFIYSTYAKLNEYWDNTRTLNSMGNSTMNELTYYEHSYN